jgi:hypothetical protein
VLALRGELRCREDHATDALYGNQDAEDDVVIERWTHRLSLRPQVLVKESFDGGISMSAVVLSYESVLRPGVNHDIEGFAQVLQRAKELGAVQE